MKWILPILVVCSHNMYTMEHKFPCLLKTCISQLTSLIRTKPALSDEDLQKATQLIKQIRAQSPSSAFVCETQLQDAITRYDIRTDCKQVSQVTPKEGLFRGPSPLIANGTYND